MYRTIFIAGRNVIFKGTDRKWKPKDNVQNFHIAQHNGYSSALTFLNIFMDICVLYICATIDVMHCDML